MPTEILAVDVHSRSRKIAPDALRERRISVALHVLAAILQTDTIAANFCEKKSLNFQTVQRRSCMGQPWSTRMTHTGKQTVFPAPALAGRLGTALEGRYATALEGRYATALEGRYAAALEGRLGAALEGRLGTALEGRLATALEGRVATGLRSFARLPSTANPIARKSIKTTSATPMPAKHDCKKRKRTSS